LELSSQPLNIDLQQYKIDFLISSLLKMRLELNSWRLGSQPLNIYIYIHNNTKLNFLFEENE